MAEEPEYGETTATREQAANAPMPQEPPPAEPEEIAQEAAAQTQEAQTEEAPIPEPPPEVFQPQGFTVRNPYMLLPPSVNLAPRRKTQPERLNDVGMLWEALASDPQADPLIQMIAKSLIGKD
jgi:hypothetical protein